MTKAQEDYQAYLKTDYWKEVSAAVKARDGFRCRVCNSPESLEVHHRCYRHKGAEKEHLNDLTTLCRKCHGLYHSDPPRPILAVKVVPPAPSGPSVPDVLVTRSNFHRLRSNTEMWHYYRGIGVNPRKKGWMKRMIGRAIPAHFLR
jgi:hypothetical protein